MPKKIAVEQLRVGMYLSGLEGNWLDHPFWRTRFLIRDEPTLAKLLASGIRECFIDPSKGEDLLPPLPAAVEVAEVAVAQAASAASGDADPGQAAATEAPATAAVDSAHADPEAGFEVDVELGVEVDMAGEPEPDAVDAAGASPLPEAPSQPQRSADKRRIVMTPAEQAFADELERAGTVLERAGALSRMLQQVASTGQPLPVAEAFAVVEAMLASMVREPSALVSLARLKRHEDYGWRHPVAVAALMLALARELGLDAATTQAAGLAGLVHDIGHVQLPQDLLAHPGALDDTQMSEVQKHASAAETLMGSSTDWPSSVAEACAQHHERLDGSGYPKGLAGDAINRLARMLAVCDVYDALSSNRPYQFALDPAETISRITSSNGGFDGAIVSAFVRRMGLYPVGSLVELESQRLAVVLWQNSIAMSDPVVRIFYCLQERKRISPQHLDLASADAQDFVVGRVSPADWPVGNVEALWSHGHAGRILGPGALAGRAELAGRLRT